MRGRRCLPKQEHKSLQREGGGSEGAGGERRERERRERERMGGKRVDKK